MSDLQDKVEVKDVLDKIVDKIEEKKTTENNKNKKVKIKEK